MSSRKIITGTPCRRHAGPDTVSCERYEVNSDCVRAAIERVAEQRANPKKWAVLREKANERRREKKNDPDYRAEAAELRRLKRKKEPRLTQAREHVARDERRGHSTFVSREFKLAAVHVLAKTYKAYPELQRCRVDGCINEATAWDEVVYGQGHVPGNISRLCTRHNRLKADATLQELEALVLYVQKMQLTSTMKR